MTSIGLRSSSYATLVFPRRDAAIAPALAQKYVDEAASELHKRIGEVLPPPDDGLIEEWPAWPYLRIELPRSEVERLEQASESERVLLRDRS